MRVRHPPGRGGRMWLAERIQTATRAADLLEQKERVLTREQRRLLVLQRADHGEWDAAWRLCQTWIARASILRGRRVISLAAQFSSASVELVWRNSMGADYPAEVTCRLPEERPLGEIAATAAMVETVRADRAALERAVQLAATDRAVREVDRELRATRRRLRMLQRQWIPSLGAALHALDIELEERERDDIIHARWTNALGAAR